MSETAHEHQLPHDEDPALTVELLQDQAYTLENRLPQHAETLTNFRISLPNIAEDIQTEAEPQKALAEKDIATQEQVRIDRFTESAQAMKDAGTTARVAKRLTPVVAANLNVPELINVPVEPKGAFDTLVDLTQGPRQKIINNPQINAIEEKIIELVPDRIDGVIGVVPGLFKKRLAEKDIPEDIALESTASSEENHPVVAEFLATAQKELEGLAALTDQRALVQVGKLAARVQRGKSEQQRKLDSEISRIVRTIDLLAATAADKPLKYVETTKWYRDLQVQKKELIAARGSVLGDVLAQAHDQLSSDKNAGLSRYMLQAITKADIPPLTAEGQKEQRPAFEAQVMAPVDDDVQELRTQGKSDKEIMRALQKKYADPTGESVEKGEQWSYLNTIFGNETKK